MTLIELMVALVLGLIVAGAAMAVFLVNRQTYVATENLGRLQESARTAFEFMAKDIRAAGMIPCSNETALNNIVDSTEWWTAHGSGSTPTEQWERSSFLGYSTADGDALQLIAAIPPNVVPTVVADVPPLTFPIVLGLNNTDDIVAGDILLVCDYGVAGERGPEGAIFQASAVGASITIGTSGTPGNTSLSDPKGLFFPTPDLPQPNGLVSEVRPVRWYIGDNAHGGKSLFRTRLVNDAGTLSLAEDEIVANADGMTLSYLVSGASSYVAAAAVPAASWSKVVAVRIQLHMTGTDRVDGEQVERTLEHVVAVRNRVL